MPRQITVKLGLDVRDYNKGAAEAEATTKALNGQLRSLDDNSRSVTRDMSSTARETEKAKKQTVDFGDKTRALIGDVKGLDNQIKAAKLSVGQLSVQFAQSGSTINRNNLNDAKRVLAVLEKTRKDILQFASSDSLRRAAQLASAGVAEGVADEAGSIIGKLVPLAMKSPLVTGIAALAPVIAPVLGGLVVGAFTGVGIAGGIASAAKDPRVKTAFAGFLQGIEGEFFNSSSSAAFVAPTIQALDILSKDFKALNLGDAFSKAASSVPILASGIGDFAKNLMPGFNAVLDQSQKITVAFANGLDSVGTSISKTLESILHSPGTIEALDDGLVGTGKALEFVGQTIHVLGDVYDLGRSAAAGIALLTSSIGGLQSKLAPLSERDSGFLNLLLGGGVVPGQIGLSQVGHQVNQVTDAYDKLVDTVNPTRNAVLLTKQQEHELTLANTFVADSFSVAAHQSDRYRTSLQDLNIAVSDTIDNELNLWRDTLNVEQAMADATDTIKKNGRQWDQNTQAARDNQSAIENALRAAKREYDDAVKAADGNKQAIDAATRAYDAQVRKLEALAKQAGATQKELASIEGNYYINIITTSPAGATSGSIRAHHHAAGTPYATPNMPYWAGEQGPELITAAVPTRVTPMSRVWSGGGGGDSNRTITVVVKDTSGRTLRTELITEAYGRGVASTTVNAAYP